MSGGTINAILDPWFDRRRTLAVSLAMAGSSRGGIFATPLLVSAISRLGFANGADGSGGRDVAGPGAAGGGVAEAPSGAVLPRAGSKGQPTASRWAVMGTRQYSLLQVPYAPRGVLHHFRTTSRDVTRRTWPSQLRTDSELDVCGHWSHVSCPGTPGLTYARLRPPCAGHRPGRKESRPQVRGAPATWNTRVAPRSRCPRRGGTLPSIPHRGRRPALRGHAARIVARADP